MLDRRWLHGERRLAVAARITGSVPAFLWAWTGNSWSCSNHFSPLPVKELIEFQNLEILCNNPSPQTAPTDNAWMISGLKLSSTLPKVANKSWKQRQIKGDRWRPAKNPPMAKLVSLWFWFEGKVNRSSESITLFVDQCFYSTPTEQSSPFM